MIKGGDILWTGQELLHLHRAVNFKESREETIKTQAFPPPPHIRDKSHTDGGDSALSLACEKLGAD